MSWSIVNRATADNYVGQNAGGAELLCPTADVLVLTVANAAVLYQLGAGDPPQYEAAEHQALPGVWTLPRRLVVAADAIRVRSLAAGVPAQVSISGY